MPCADPFFFIFKINIMNWFIENWSEIVAIITGLITVAEIIVNLTPSEEDNSILLKIKNALSAIIPNLKSGGGTH